MLERLKQYWWAFVLAGVAFWAGTLVFYTFFTPKTDYERYVEIVADLLGGKKADDFDEAREILEQVNALLREPAVDQRLYINIKEWLAEMKNGNPNREDRENITKRRAGMANDTTKKWKDVEQEALHEANILLSRPPDAGLPNLSTAGVELKKKLEAIEKRNDSVFNRRLDSFLESLKDPEKAVCRNPALLDEINEFLGRDVPERAGRWTLFSETIVVPHLVEFLDDDKSIKRRRIYDVIVRVVALARTRDFTATEPSEEATKEVREIFNYDPDEPSEKRRAAMKRMREWLNGKDNKKIYNP